MTESTGTITITATDNEVDAPDKNVTVSATVTNTLGVVLPSDVTLEIVDDEASPTVTLVLDPDSINENGGKSTIKATTESTETVTTTGVNDHGSKRPWQ